MATSLTHSQRQVLEFIQSYLAGKGTAPTYEEIAAHMGNKSKSGVHRIVACLEERGHIRRLANRARAMELVDAGALVSQQPFVRIVLDAENRVKRVERSGGVKVVTVRKANVTMERA